MVGTLLVSNSRESGLPNVSVAGAQILREIAKTGKLLQFASRPGKHGRRGKDVSSAGPFQCMMKKEE
jgi:hypothetical protein